MKYSFVFVFLLLSAYLVWAFVLTLVKLNPELIRYSELLFFTRNIEIYHAIGIAFLASVVVHLLLLVVFRETN